jgi:phosphoribosylglycinamide formyltransferase-1
MQPALRIGALISGGGSNLQAIIDACVSGAITGCMVFVGSDNPEAGGLERARKAGVPRFVVDYAAILAAARQGSAPAPPSDFDAAQCLSRQRLYPRTMGAEELERKLVLRAHAESRLLAAMAPYPFDLLVLAGFMRNLSPYFIDRVNTAGGLPRIMNIHPALLPAFPGVDGYGDTFRHGCKVGGCTVHFVDYGEDSGPIIGQRAFAIAPHDTLETIRRKGLALEWSLYPECIQLYAQGRLELLPTAWERDGGRRFQRVVVRQRPANP